MRTTLVATVVALGAAASVAVAQDARACGGCFHGPTQNGDPITAHRMIFSVSPTQTTLYDEIEYTGDPQSFAWVLPISGPVTVGLSSDTLFAALDQATQTTIVSPNLPACPSCSCADFGASGSSGGSGGGTLTAGGVNVLSQQVVGPYDTVQLQSTDPNALTSWLTVNGYSIPDAIAPIIAAYVQDGFDFLALKLQPGAGVQAMRPVRVSSPGAGMTLPLRMVAAGTGPQVSITLWVVGQGRYEPTNFPSFTIDPSKLVWDWTANASQKPTTRRSSRQAEATASYAAPGVADRARAAVLRPGPSKNNRSSCTTAREPERHVPDRHRRRRPSRLSGGHSDLRQRRLADRRRRRRPRTTSIRCSTASRRRPRGRLLRGQRAAHRRADVDHAAFAPDLALAGLVGLELSNARRLRDADDRHLELPELFVPGHGSR